MLYLLKTLFFIDLLIAVALVLFRWALAPRYRGVVTGKIAALALSTPVVALFSGSMYLFCAYLATIVAFNSRSRAELAATYVFLLPLTPVLNYESGTEGFYFLAITTAAAMGLGALIGFAVTQGRRSLSQTRFDMSVLLLIFMFIFIDNRDASVTGLLRGLTINVVGFAGPYLLISRGMSSREDIERLLLRLALGAVVTAFTASFQAVRHWVVFEAYYQALNVPFPITSATLSLRAGFLRTGGSMGDYSAGGLFLAAALCLMPMLRSRFKALGFWTMIAILVGGLFATQSRGAWVAAIVGLLFIAAYRGLWGRVVLLAGASIAAEAMILLFATSGRLATIAGRTEEASGTVTYRQQLLSRGLEQIQAYPLFGQSPRKLVANLPDLVQGQHIVDFVNAHLYVAMTAGIPLFIAWCYIWFGVVVEAWRKRSQRLSGGDLMEAPAAIIVPVMVALVATSIMDRNLTWPIIAVALAGPCLAVAGKRHRASKSANPPLLVGRNLLPQI